MSDDEPRDDASDRELGTWLRLWEPPQPSSELDGRVIEAYRSAQRRPRATRLLRARVSLPLPMAALLVALLFGAGAAAAHGLRHGQPPLGAGGQPLASTSGGLAELSPLPEIRMTVVRRGESDVHQ